MPSRLTNLYGYSFSYIKYRLSLAYYFIIKFLIILESIIALPRFPLILILIIK